MMNAKKSLKSSTLYTKIDEEDLSELEEDLLSDLEDEEEDIDF